MDNLMEQINELNQLKTEQALHRQQLEENRQRALSKRNQTKYLVTLGKIVKELLPADTTIQTKDELLELLKSKLDSDETY